MLKNILAALSIMAPIIIASAIDGRTEQPTPEPTVYWSDEDLHRAPPNSEQEFAELEELIALHRAQLEQVRR